jgi:hypothetical protein
MWKSVGFMMSSAAVFELVTLVAFSVLITGGKQKRETGWKVLAFMLMLVGILQCAAMAIVVCIYLSVESSAVWLIPYSHTCSILMTAFLSAGNCLRAGFSAQLAGFSASS